MVTKAPSSFSLWLDEALSGWILPVAALLAVAAVGGLYLAGVASEYATATLIVVAVGVGVALFVLRPALDPRRAAPSRALAAAASALTLVATVLPALRTVNPGDPLFTGEAEKAGDAIAVPGGVSGAVRLLVFGRLADRGEPSVSFVIGGTREPVEGKLERTYGYARVGRGGRARVAHDHTADFYPASLPPGTTALQLRRLQGQLSGPLHVEAFREPIPVAGGPWILAALALLAAGLADARLALRNNLAVAARMAVAFGLLVTYNATPAAAVGPAVGAIVLGALCGSLAGWAVGAVVRRLVPPAPRRAPGRSDGTVVA